MKKGYTHITFLLDKSGSMSKIASDVIGGFNQFLADQKKQKGDCSITLVQFDDQYEVNYEFANIGYVSDLNSDSYKVRGWTKLLDAIGKSINSTGQRLSLLPEQERPERVLFVIQTDGLENRSNQFSRQQIANMIKHQQDAYSWTFVFLGANQDAFLTAQTYGIDNLAANTLSFKATSKGVQDSYASISKGVSNYRSLCSTQSEKDFAFFDEEDKQKQR